MAQRWPERILNASFCREFLCGGTLGDIEFFRDLTHTQPPLAIQSFGC